jgi:tRNA pseudouridine(55) synthase
MSIRMRNRFVRQPRSTGTRGSMEARNTRDGRERIVCISWTDRANSAYVSHYLRLFSGVVTSIQHRRFSALKMDGKPLYEYARSGTPLPRKIEKRPVTIHSLEIEEWLGSDHNFRYPEQLLSEAQKRALEKTLRSVQEDVRVVDEPEELADDDRASTAFVLKMRVSGGTYVRSIVHDLGHALGSAAHVVTLTRSRQGRFTSEPTEVGDIGCVSWDIFKAAIEDVGPADEDGYAAWEREVLDKFEVIDTSTVAASSDQKTDQPSS